MASGEPFARKAPGSLKGKETLVKQGKRPQVVQANGLHAIVRGNNAFALDLFSEIAGEKDEAERNIFFSPFSISDALAMTFAGARGETEKQMVKVLHFTLPQKVFHPTFSRLINTMQALSKEKSTRLLIANALWGQKDYKFLPGFVGLINHFYGGGFFPVDYIRHTEETRKRINRWVEEKTSDKIKNLLHRGDIDSSTRLVLTNAIYFKGKWASQFRKKNTRTMPFHESPAKLEKVDMMFQEGRFPYLEEQNLQVLELPYVGSTLSMVVFLPSKTLGLKKFEKGLNEKKVRDLLSSLRKREVTVYLPRFKLKTRYLLAQTLSKMGMPDAFSNKADFSGMTGKKDLKISRVIHQAYVEVNEEGTEAAASTGVVMRLKAVMRHPVFRADHPFIFMIIHKETGSILFMGRVMNPLKP